MGQSSQSEAIARFNAVAEAWDDSPTRVDLAHAVAGGILARVPLTGAQRALEFGCGTGLVTALIAPHVRSVIAADSAEAMLSVLRRKARDLGLENIDARVVDLPRDIPPGPFDLIFSSMTLHHIEDVAGLFSGLARTLDPGGWIAVADLEPEDGSFHGDDVPGIMHLGFQRDALTDWLTDAGFEAVSIERVHVITKTAENGQSRSYPVFLACARVPC